MVAELRGGDIGGTQPSGVVEKERRMSGRGVLETSGIQTKIKVKRDKVYVHIYLVVNVNK